jgi:hypothetical protein
MKSIDRHLIIRRQATNSCADSEDVFLQSVTPLSLLVANIIMNLVRNTPPLWTPSIIHKFLMWLVRLNAETGTGCLWFLL